MEVRTKLTQSNAIKITNIIKQSIGIRRLKYLSVETMNLKRNHMAFQELVASGTVLKLHAHYVIYLGRSTLLSVVPYHNK